MDQSKKTMRHFYCRDALWDMFEQMANDFDCSIDYLVNEAMRHYARSKNYQSSVQRAQQPAPPYSPVDRYTAESRSEMGQRPTQQRDPGLAPPPPPAAGMRNPRPSQGDPRHRQDAHAPALSSSAAPAAAAGEGTLYLWFDNKRFPINKDQFIIGRGTNTSDLPIKDGNISRKHAAVIRRNGTFYIKDLGSTNGIDYKGMRIDNKRVDEGDVFHLCDYELRFTYRDN